MKKGELLNTQPNPKDSAVCVTENRMTFIVGNKVFYPFEGPCLIGAVVKKTVAGHSESFYRLAPLDNSGKVFFVPVDKTSAVRVRPLMPASEIPKLLGHLERSVTAPQNWKQRDLQNARLLSSGLALDLAEIVQSLTDLNETKPLSPRDCEILNRARRFLICEIAEVTGENKGTAEEKLDAALKLRANIRN